jgi:glycosyltransferase involved in cell wall biosynthesis
MLISVLIANYNYSQFLASAVESIVAQSFRDLELVIVDDGSSDGSCDLIRQLLDTHSNRFVHSRYVLKSENSGKLAALNVGIPLLRGDLTLILDADDYLLPGYLEKTTEHLLTASSRNSNIAFVYTDCKLVDVHGRHLARGRSTHFDADLLDRESYIPECAVTVTAVLKDSLPFDEAVRFGTKHHKWRRVVASGGIGEYLPLPLFCYRMHDRNISGIGRKVLSDLNQNRKITKLLSGYWTRSICEMSPPSR